MTYFQVPNSLHVGLETSKSLYPLSQYRSDPQKKGGGITTKKERHNNQQNEVVVPQEVPHGDFESIHSKYQEMAVLKFLDLGDSLKMYKGPNNRKHQHLDIWECNLFCLTIPPPLTSLCPILILF